MNIYKSPGCARITGAIVASLCAISTNAQSSKQIDTLYIKSQWMAAKDIASFQSARMPVLHLENPQVVNTVGGLLVKHRNYFSQDDYLSNVNGLSKGWASVAPYYNLRGFVTRSYVRNGLDGYLSAQMDPANLEEMTVLKGPSGTLFGSSLVSFGGVINRITKRPIDSTFSHIRFASGNYGFHRMTVDINNPLDRAHRMLFRLNAAYTDQNSFQDAGFSRVGFLAPSFSYQVNSKLNISLESEIQYRRGTSLPQIQPENPIQMGGKKYATHPAQLPLNYNSSYSNNSIYLNDPAVNIYGKIEYRISKNWTSQTNLINTWTENTGNYLLLGLTNGDSSLLRKITKYPSGTMQTQQIQQNIIGDFVIGKIRNRIVAGFDYYRNSTNTTSNGLNGTGMSMGGMNMSGNAARPAFDTINLYGSNPNIGLLSPSEIDAKLIGKQPTMRGSLQNTYSAYISDVVNPVKNLAIMLSGRIDRFLNAGTTDLVANKTTGAYNQTAFSPKLGVSYILLQNRLSLFTNYMNGFQNTAPVMQSDGTTSVFKPQHGNQWEGGFKVNMPHHLLDATISYYAIQVGNVVRNDPANPTMYIQDGKQYSQGFEADIASQPLNGFYLHGGMAYNKSKYSVANSSTEGLRPVNSGPKWMANGYANYTIPRGKVQGLGIGLGANYVGKDLIINSTSAGTFYTAAYTLLNSNISYDRARYTFTISINNLTNKHYYYGGSGFITPGNLRQIIASISLKF